jgi:hypothetical protein
MAIGKVGTGENIESGSEEEEEEEEGKGAMDLGLPGPRPILLHHPQSSSPVCSLIQ